jgi:hypothetical protein
MCDVTVALIAGAGLSALKQNYHLRSVLPFDSFLWCGACVVSF